MEEKESDNFEDETVSCPVCGKWVKSIFAHLGKSKQCKETISPEDLLKFENIRTLKRKMQNKAESSQHFINLCKFNLQNTFLNE